MLRKNKKIVSMLAAVLVLSILSVAIHALAEESAVPSEAINMQSDSSPEELTTALPASAADFNGIWNNIDQNTRSTVKFVITETNTFHGYGACTPTPCDWGTTPLKISSKGNTAFARYNFGFKDQFIFLLMLGPKSIVEVDFNIFKDGSGRKPYFAWGIFRKMI